MRRLESTQDAIDSLEDYLDTLYDRSVIITNMHWQYVYENDKRFDWSKRSQLYPRCNRKLGSLTFSLEWYKTRWVGAKTKGNRQRIKEYLSKPKQGHAYSDSKLSSLARDWEVDKVRETEAAFSWIRRETYQITRALISLRAFARSYYRTHE